MAEPWLDQALMDSAYRSDRRKQTVSSTLIIIWRFQGYCFALVEGHLHAQSLFKYKTIQIKVYSCWSTIISRAAEFPKWISEPGQPFRSQFVLHLALWAGLACATKLTRSDIMLNIGWIHFYYRGRGTCVVGSILLELNNFFNIFKLEVLFRTRFILNQV